MLVRLFIAGAAIGAFAVGASLSAPTALAQRPYKNCSQAHADGVWDITEDDPAYWSGGDRDGDGVACES